MSITRPAIHAVLFDLDGTLLDTAPDLTLALNNLLQAHRRNTVKVDDVRDIVSQGSVALTRYGFPEVIDSDEFEVLRQEFMQHYLNAVCIDTEFFNGIESLLTTIESKNIPWGIVTNKPGAMTIPLLEQLALDQRPQCIVSGDTLNLRKPHPEPLLHASDILGLSPQQTIYIGDDLRDIYAGNEAGMYTCIAEYGYIEKDIDTNLWGADFTISHPLELLDYITLSASINDMGT